MSFYLRLSASKLRFEAREANRVEKERKNLRNNKITYKQDIVKSAPLFRRWRWSPCLGVLVSASSPRAQRLPKKKAKKLPPQSFPLFARVFLCAKKARSKSSTKALRLERSQPCKSEMHTTPMVLTRSVSEMITRKSRVNERKRLPALRPWPSCYF